MYCSAELLLHDCNTAKQGLNKEKDRRNANARRMYQRERLQKLLRRQTNCFGHMTSPGLDTRWRGKCFRHEPG